MQPDVPTKVHENVETIAELRVNSEQRAGAHQRTIEAWTRLIGRPSTVYALLGVVVVWVSYNLIAPLVHCRQVDAPPFFWLDGVLGLYAAVVSTIVLTTQNRQNYEAERRDHLGLQVNLLTEQKTTKVIQLLEELRRDLPNVFNREDPVARAMQEEVDPHTVIAALESTMETPTDHTAEPDSELLTLKQ